MTILSHWIEASYVLLLHGCILSYTYFSIIVCHFAQIVIQILLTEDVRIVKNILFWAVNVCPQINRDTNTQVACPWFDELEVGSNNGFLS